MAFLTSLGGVTVTVSLSERSCKIGLKDLADSIRYFWSVSRFAIALRVKAGSPLRSISMEVAMGDTFVCVAALAGSMACAGGVNGRGATRSDVDNASGAATDRKAREHSSKRLCADASFISTSSLRFVASREDEVHGGLNEFPLLVGFANASAEYGMKITAKTTRVFRIK